MAIQNKEMERLKYQAPEAVELLRQLANTNRLMILCHLSSQERSVGEMEADLGIKQPALSQQLAELRQFGLVKTRRQSRSIYYSISDERTQHIMSMLYAIFCTTGEINSGPITALVAKPAAQSGGDAARFARITSPARR